jgi:hypothetical protein
VFDADDMALAIVAGVSDSRFSLVLAGAGYVGSYSPTANSRDVKDCWIEVPHSRDQIQHELCSEVCRFRQISEATGAD